MNWKIAVGAIFVIGGIGNIGVDFSTFLFSIAIGGVLIYLGIKKKQAIKSVATTHELKVEEFAVLGIPYYLDNISKLANKNPEWNSNCAQVIAHNNANRRIYRFNYINKPVKLIPDPKNKYDKNAVQVIIAGELVGFIGEADNVHVKEILTKHDVKYISSFIGGGKYKIVTEEKEMNYFEDEIHITVKIGYV